MNAAPAWWQVAITVTQALTGVSVAWFAWARWRGDNIEKTARRSRAQSRISTTAFQVRRQLRSWLGLDRVGRNPLLPGDEIGPWLRSAQQNNSLKVELDIA